MWIAGTGCLVNDGIDAKEGTVLSDLNAYSCAAKSLAADLKDGISWSFAGLEYDSQGTVESVHLRQVEKVQTSRVSIG